MLLDWISNEGPLALESDALPTGQHNPVFEFSI